MVLVELAVLVLLVLGGWVVLTGDNDRRREAAKRLAFGLPFLLVMALIGTLYGIYVTLTWLIDSLWELVTGRQGFTPGGRASRLEHWRTSNTKWVLTGEGEPRLFP